MGMRLLTKSEIVKAQSADRAKEVAEGLKISRRVDALRELQAKEEESLNKFRDESLSATQREIDILTGKRDILSQEINKLNAERAKGMEEVERRSKEVDSLKLKLEEKEIFLDDSLDSLKNREELTEDTLEEAKAELVRATSHKEEQNRLHSEAYEDRKLAAKEIKEARKIKKDIEKDQKTAEQFFSLRKEQIEIREKECSIREKENEQISLELEITRKQLADQRAMLERSLKRLNRKTD